MSNKTDHNSFNSSNGFKKRLLRPVSNNKHSSQVNIIKTNKPLNLRDSISIKNKYAQAYSMILNLVQQIQIMPLQNMTKNQNDSYTNLKNSSISLRTKGQEYIKNYITEFKQKRQIAKKMKFDGQNELKTINKKQKTIQKSINKILQETKVQNMEQGIKIIYKQKQQLKQFIQASNFILSFNLLNKIKIHNLNQENNIFSNITGNQQQLQLFAKLLTNYCKYEQQNSSKNNKQQSKKIQENNKLQSKKIQENQNNDIPKTKFKAIFTSRKDQQKDEQIQCLKQQLQKQRTINLQLNKLLQQKQESSKSKQSNQSSCKISKKIQQVSKQIKQIYQEIVKQKNQDISKLKNQLLQTQQLLSNQQSIKSFNGNNQSNNDSIRISRLKDPDSKQFSVTVQQEFQKMRSGFTKKIQKLESQFTQKQKKLKKQLFNLQRSIQNLQTQKKLILKKYQFLLQSQ